MVIREVARPKSREDFEIAIVCTEDVEYNAVCLVLDGFWDDDGDSFGRAIRDFNTYTIGYMEGFNIVITLLCNSGKATAASTAASLRSSYPRIELLLLTRNCDGVPNVMGKELLLGDIAISDTVIQYDLGRRYADGFREKDTLEESLGRPDKNVRNLITVLKTDLGQRLEEDLSSYLRKMMAIFNPPSSRLFIESFGSGDTSFSAGIDRDRIAQKHSIIAFETEDAGVWDELPCIIIKGVATYGDGHEMGDSEAWQNFAAATAACAARGLISRYPQTDKSLVLESKNQMDIVFTSQADITCFRTCTSPARRTTRFVLNKPKAVYCWMLTFGI